METTKKVWINGLFLAVTLVVNTLGALGLINGLSQKEISDMFVTLITPSPATFSIWSVIYSLLLITVIVMIIKKDEPYYKSAVNQITVLFRISCMLNIAWIVAFSYVQIELSVLFILGFVITLSLICRKLLKIQDRKRWLLPLSFGIYQYLNAPEGFNGEYGFLKNAALAGMVVLIGMAAIRFYRNHLSLLPN